MLFSHRDRAGNIFVYEASGSSAYGKVVNNKHTEKKLKGKGYKPYRYHNITDTVTPRHHRLQLRHQSGCTSVAATSLSKANPPPIPQLFYIPTVADALSATKPGGLKTAPTHPSAVPYYKPKSSDAMKTLSSRRLTWKPDKPYRHRFASAFKARKRFLIRHHHYQSLPFSASNN